MASNPPPYPSVVFPAFTSESGAYVEGQQSVSTSGALGNGSLRLTQFPVMRSFTIAAMGAEFTVAGDAASLFLMAIYADDGKGYPGALFFNGGSISTGSGNAGTVSTGGTPGVYFNTGLSKAVPPGLYWIGGVVQGVSSVQPTMRTGVYSTGWGYATNSAPGTGATSAGYFQTGVTGALPSTFQVFASSSAAGSIPRVAFQVT